MKKISRREFCRVAAAAWASLSLLPLAVSRAFAELAGKKGYIDRKEAMWWEKTGTMYRCGLCPNGCILKPGVRSPCLAREADDEKLYTLTHSNPASINVDPIEKKPLFHFLPGTRVFSMAAAGCNFSCLNCQNWQISQIPPDNTYNYRFTPADAVKSAAEYSCPTIAYTYSEPTTFYEYMFDTSAAAHKKGIKNVSVTNGYINPEPLKKLSDFLDGSNVDIKGFSEDFYARITGGRLQPVLDTVKNMKEYGIHVEVTNLILPGYNDEPDLIKKLCGWILENTGNSTPLHFSRFYPRYKLKNLPPTPAETLIKSRELALSMGLNYVYVGNLPEYLEGQNTYCHNCRRLVIGRKGYRITSFNIEKSRCGFCGTIIPGVWS